MNTTPRDIQRSERTVTEAVAAPVACRRGPQSPWVEALLELGALDRAVYEAVATTPTAHLDRPLRRLSHSADAGALWLVIAGGVADSRSTWPSRRQGSGDVTRRHRDHRQPRRQIDLPTSTTRSGWTRPHARGRVPTPSSSSFPSGHSATSFAFAYTVGRHLPFVGIPIRLLAAAVAYSRVHIGVHYPGDVIIGSIMGAGTAAAIGSAWDHRRP